MEEIKDKEVVDKAFFEPKTSVGQILNMREIHGKLKNSDWELFKKRALAEYDSIAEAFEDITWQYAHGAQMLYVKKRDKKNSFSYIKEREKK